MLPSPCKVWVAWSMLDRRSKPDDKLRLIKPMLDVTALEAAFPRNDALNIAPKDGPCDLKPSVNFLPDFPPASLASAGSPLNGLLSLAPSFEKTVRIFPADRSDSVADFFSAAACS